MSEVKDPNVLAGYVQETQHREAYGIDGWFNIGDLGNLDEQGYFWLTGRVG